MNYARHRLKAKEKLLEKQSQLLKLTGKDRVKAESILIEQSKQEQDQDFGTADLADESEPKQEKKVTKNGPKPRR